MPSGPCVCRRQRAALAAGQARAVPSARRDRPPPSRHWWRALAERPMCVPPAERCARSGTGTRCAVRAPRSPLTSRRWPRTLAERPMCVPPAARRERGGTSTRCAVRAPRSPSPATAGRGRMPSGPCVCHRQRAARAAGQARAVPSARRDRPPQPQLAEGACRGALVWATGSALRGQQDRHALCRPRAAIAPPPAGTGGGRLPSGPCVCHLQSAALAAGRARAVPSARRDRL